MEKVLPPTQEDYRFGMNTYDNAKKLREGVYQLIENAYPGTTLKPLNGVNDKIVSTVQLGYGTKDSFFRPPAIYFEANDKEFIFCWHHNATTTDEFALEIWNITDSTRTKLIYGDFDETGVYFSMNKLYDAVYITMNYEMQTNHVSTYRTKNKIVEWDSDAAAWLVREMGIDVAGSFQSLSIEDMAQPAWSKRGGHRVVEFKNKLWMLGGTDLTDGINDECGLYYSTDGNSWVSANTDVNFGGLCGAGFIVFLNKLWIIGGCKIIGGGHAYTPDVYSSVDGETWVLETDTPGFSARNGHSVLVYGNYLWVIGGGDAGANKKDVWKSWNGVSWQQIDNDAEWGLRTNHTSLVYDGKMWVIGGDGPGGGVPDAECWWSVLGTDWTAVASGVAAFGNVYMHTSVLFQGKMWVICGSTGAAVDDVYSSSDGITWTEETADTGFTDRSMHASCVFDNKIWVWGGWTGAALLNDIYSSSDGATWASTEGGITPALYYNYAATFVRRTDASSKLASMDDYVYTIWENYNGIYRVSIDEKLLTGTVSLATTALTGTDTAFDTELAADDYIRIDGKFKKYKITSVTDATHAVVVNADSDTYTTKQFSLLPTVGDAITTNLFHPGVVEGIGDIDQRRCLYIIPPAGSSANGRVFIELPDITDAVAQGATHLRVYRSLGNAVKATAEGLVLRYNVDISITGDAFYSLKIYPDNTTDNALTGETNFLEMTGYSVPPLGRYSIWTGNALCIGGVPDEGGKWFHSVIPGTAGVSFDTQFPQKYASMFDLDEDFVTCEPADGQEDSGCAILNGDLYFLKERKVFVLYNANFDNKPDNISDGIGCACPNTIIKAYIPLLGGHCILFLSESGPAYIKTGGQVGLLMEFAIEELWPGREGILMQSDGTSTDWYTRNKVTSAFWDNTWWVFFGDSRDGNCQLSENKVFGFHFDNSGISVGAFQRNNSNYDLAGSDLFAHMDTDDQGYEALGVAVDTREDHRLLFLANGPRGLESYKYNSAGKLSHIANDDQGGEANGVALDIEDHLLFLANYDNGLESYSYDSDGAITHVDNDQQDPTSKFYGVVVDPDWDLVFGGSEAQGLASYSYDPETGILSYVENYTHGSVNSYRLAIDTKRKLLFVTAYGNGFYVCRYNSSGNLTNIPNTTPSGLVGSSMRITVDIVNQLVFFSVPTIGVDVCRYDDAGKLSYISSEAIVNNTNGACVDTEIKRIYVAAGNNGVYAYSYEQSVDFSSAIDSNKQGGATDYAHEPVLDTSLGLLFVAYKTIGVVSYKLYAKNRIYEPQVLIPVDNNTSYTLSHCPDAAGDIHYRLTRFLDPSKFEDTFDEITLAYNMAAHQRQIHHGFGDEKLAIIIKALIDIIFDDTDGLTITINIDGTRLTAECVYSQDRQSGMLSTGMEAYRKTLSITAPESLQENANYFDLKVSKVVPDDGEIELFSQRIKVMDTERVSEFSDSFAAPTGATTFVVEADTSPEVDANKVVADITG